MEDAALGDMHMPALNHEYKTYDFKDISQDSYQC